MTSLDLSKKQLNIRYWKYTPLYEKGIKESENKSMETTQIQYVHW